MALLPDFPDVAVAGPRTDTADPLLDAVGRGLRIYDLAWPMFVGMPQSPNHPRFAHSLPRRHGDMVRGDGGSAANDLIVTGTHVGTHIDALAHVSHDGRLHDGSDAAAAGVGGRYLHLGVHTIEPMVRRGVLLDIPALHQSQACEPGYEISAADLDAAATAQATPVRPGDVVLIRSGWGKHFDNPQAYQGLHSGVPGVSGDGARWLAARDVHAAGADTIAFERLAPDTGHGLLPAHRILLVEHGIYIIEALALEELATAQAYEFTFVLSPLKLLGATGSPVRPLALIGGTR